MYSDEQILKFESEEFLYSNPKLYKTIYNQALEEFTNKIKLKFLGVNPDELLDKFYPNEIVGIVEEIAEQLKGERIV